MIRRVVRPILFAIPVAAGAQHPAGHGMPERDSTTRIMATLGAQAVVSGTRLTNALDGRTRAEGYVSQPALMGHASRGPVAFTGTINFEGLTLGRGELLGGVYGEGYVDRRHPHTLVHEAMAAVQGGVGTVRASLAVGKGFVPFGTDDPMMRPFERYPVNHHLAQILERAVAIGAVRTSRALLEVATFNGDEPSGPYTAPRWQRFGDSWSSRLSVLPLAPAPDAGWSATGLELSASVASVRAPENPHGGGLDQHKWSVAARWASGAPLGGGSRDLGDGTYALAEWARTDWLRNGQRIDVDGYRDASLLAEGGVRHRGVELVARAEHTDRLEEERAVDPFRTVRPASDAATLGVTRWTTFTVGIARPMAFGDRALFRAAPFVELTALSPGRTVDRGLFDPASFYGGDRLFAATVGLRLGAGTSHARMGRYGVSAVSHPMR